MKKQNRFIFLSLLILLALSATSCLKNDDDEKLEKETKIIANYIQVNGITATPSTSGLYYISEVEGTGATPVDQNFAIIRYKETDLEGNFLDGTDKDLAEQSKVKPYFLLGGPFKIFVGPNGFYSGVLEALKKMKEGGKAKLIMPAHLASSSDYIPRVIEVELIKVITNPMTYENEQISNFLDTAANNIGINDLNSGIYFIKRSSGTGTVKPAPYKTVKIRYKGSLTDGRVFDKTASDTVFKFQVGGEQAIRGLDYGIRLMVKGDSATMVIPYTEGYGLNQVPNQDRYTGKYHVIIPYFSTLVFEIKLVDIVD